MTITKWQPFGNLLTLHDRINRLFEDEFHKDWGRGTGSLESWYPAADIYETKDEYVFKLEVPGLAKEDLNVEFNDNVLSIKGEKKKEKDVKEESYHRIESFSGSFSRSFTLPRNADAGKINASMKNGVLELKISKAEEKKAKAIAIDVK
jgi:HSP20 family protein